MEPTKNPLIKSGQSEEQVDDDEKRVLLDGKTEKKLVAEHGGFAKKTL